MPNPSPTKLIRVVGQDPSLRNWGLAYGIYDLEAKKLTITKLALLNPVLPDGKQVRQNSKEIESGAQLYRGAKDATKDAHATFVEVPVGSQSARAMCGYGVCTGVLGAIRAEGIPFFELTPTEIKLAGHGTKTATKKQMIDWAMAKHPEANWPMYKRKGQMLVCEADAEHMADAVAAIYAGLACTAFQQTLPFLTANL